MKRFVLLNLFIPQLLFAQYQSKEFTLLNERNTTSQAVGVFTTRDSLVALNINQQISGLFISGTVTFDNTQDSYVRITVQDRNDIEHLVYENYPLLSDENPSRFSKVAVESVLLDDIVPSCLKIDLQGSSVQIDSIYFSDAQNLGHGFRAKAKTIRQEQTQYIAEKLNTHLIARHMTWQAGPTSIASVTFEEKKKMFGPNVKCLYGFDYYKGGLFIMDSILVNEMNKERSSIESDSFVNDFDWRNRHGKNWITSVKNQRPYNTCWDYATVATIESNFNIYFNHVFDSIFTNNLSEQELVSCLDNDGKTISQRLNNGGYVMYALDYVQRNGIVREQCFPFGGNVLCGNKCQNPVEQISFSSFRNIYKDNKFDSTKYMYNDSISKLLRKAIIKSPVVVDYFRSGGHSVSCVGFHKIQKGDYLCGNINTSYFYYVDTTSVLINHISWIIKNSWGNDWGENGFAKVTFNNVSLRLYEITPPFTSLVYSNADRCVTDEDMDGYYTWGSGIKPSNLPVWIPDEQDGDDSNPSIGAIDEYGICDTLTINPAITWYINSNVSHSVTNNFTYPNITVLQNGTLTINNSTMIMKKNSTIRVQSGGKLVINGGQIQEANIVVESGGTLIIDHGGLVQLRHNGQYLTQLGAKVTINNGKIE